MASPRPATGLSRRAVLRSLGGLGAAAFVVACGRNDVPGDPSEPATGAATGRPRASETGDVRLAILDQLEVRSPLDLSVILPAGVFVTGRGRRIVFGLGRSPTDLVTDAEPRVWLVRDEGLEVVAGPDGAPYFSEGFGDNGVYVLETALEQPGNHYLVADTGDHAAVGAISIFTADQVGVPDVRQRLPAAPTPTTKRPLGLERICTAEPPCSMHDVSLDTALDAGRPVVLTVATPEFCQTVICGPVVGVVDQLRTESRRDDIAWIHVEVYEDAGNTPVELMQTLSLPTEPWTFFVGANGKVVDRFEGPTPLELLRGPLERI